MARLAVQQVSKTYPNGTRAVERVTFEVPDGAWLVVLGPSGSGKTTLLRLLAGLETVTRGVLRFGDRIINDLPPQQRDVAMVFQHPALYPT